MIILMVIIELDVTLIGSIGCGHNDGLGFDFGPPRSDKIYIGARDFWLPELPSRDSAWTLRLIAPARPCWHHRNHYHHHHRRGLLIHFEIISPRIELLTKFDFFSCICRQSANVDQIHAPKLISNPIQLINWKQMNLPKVHYHQQTNSKKTSKFVLMNCNYLESTSANINLRRQDNFFCILHWNHN